VQLWIKDVFGDLCRRYRPDGRYNVPSTRR
jgi:hypothetical protein